MKFLQEMIAKKRAQQDEAEAMPPDAGAGGDGFVAADMPHAVSPEALNPAPAAPAQMAEEWEDDAEDDESLFDDGSYDWDLEDEAEDFEDDALEETDEFAFGAPSPHAAQEAQAAVPPASSDYDDEDDDDMADAASMVLKDIVARSRADEAPEEAAVPEPPLPPEEPSSSVERNVQKLRVQRKIWDMDAEDDGVEPAEPVAAPAPAPEPEPDVPEAVEPEAAPVAPVRRGGRVKTRILGFHKPEDAAPDPFAAPQAPVSAPGDPQFPVGWMVVMSGPGRGASFTLTAGASKIGRGEDQAIRLDFGDTSISRDNHAAVAYDGEQRSFFIGHGGKANLVRLNDMPVLSTEPMTDGDEIRIGETTLRFVAFCGPDFTWDDDGDGDSRYAAAE